VDAPGNDGKASMPEQVKRPNPCRKMNNNNNNNDNNDDDNSNNNNSCNNVSPRDMVCLRNMCMDTLHKGDNDDNNNNNNNTALTEVGTFN